MSRFYVPPQNIGEKYITIDGDEAHHVIDVMRLDEGDDVVIFDGTGKQFFCSVKSIDIKAKTVKAEIVSVKKPPEADRLVEVTLAQAIPKKGKMDYVVEKATELGVSGIVPLVTERTVVRPDDAGSGKKVTRWHKIAVEASKQCGRSDVPGVSGIMSFKELVEGMKDYDVCLLACLADGTVPIKEALGGFKSGRILVLIGPEGDFTPAEIKMAGKSNCRFISLGRRVLKSDTAGLFVLSVLGYEFPG